MCLDPPFVPITMVFYPTFFFYFYHFLGSIVYMYAYAHMHVLHAKAFCVWMSIFAVFRVDLNKTLESDRDRAPPKER